MTHTILSYTILHGMYLYILSYHHRKQYVCYCVLCIIFSLCKVLHIVQIQCTHLQYHHVLMLWHKLDQNIGQVLVGVSLPPAVRDGVPCWKMGLFVKVTA